jgi:hypothetical protein
MSTVSLPSGSALLSIARSTTVATPTKVAGVAQVGALTFTSDNTYDAVANFSSAALDSGTTKATLAVDLKAGQNYTFNRYWPAGGPKFTLLDAKGKRVANVNLAGTLKVAKSGTYQLVVEAPYSLKDAYGIDSLQMRARSVLPTSTGNSQIDALLNGGTGQWWHDANQTAIQTSATVGGAKILADGSSKTAVTYSFLTAQPGSLSMTGFQEMTTAQKDAVRRAFDYYGKLINVAFTEVTDGSEGNINFGTNVQSSSAGYAYYPNSVAKDKTYLFLANNQSSNNDAGMQEGGYGYLTVLHEIGHTLGLKHPGNYNAGGGGTPGPYLSAANDNKQLTIMSYNDNNYSRGVNPTTAMLLDVAALQSLYGVNRNASTATNGVFAFDGSKNYLQTLWSTSGNDTIDLTGTTRSSSVNLNAGTYSNIDVKNPAGGSTYSGQRNVALAYGSKINKVTLSSAANVADDVTINNAFASGGFNVINSFDAAADKIVLKRSLFSGLSGTANIEFGTAATRANTRIVVNTTTGEIFYDRDGRGKGAAVKVAQYAAITDGSLALTGNNFSVAA